MMYTVGFDISALDEGFKNHAHRGIGRYVRELQRYFDAAGVEAAPGAETRPVNIGYFDHKALKSAGSLPLKAFSKLIDCMPAGRQTLRQQCLYPLQLSSARSAKKERFHVLHFPAHMDAPAWGLRRYVLTVLDLIPLVCADLYKANKSGARFHFARFLELQAIKNASLCLCISQATANDVHRLLGVPEERLIVTPLGVDKKFFKTAPAFDDQELRTRYKLPGGRPIVLYVGGIDPRKNCRRMLQAFNEFLQARRERGQYLPVLCMAGNIQHDREYPSVERTIKELSLSDDVITPGFVPDEDLLRLYAVSACFFFPSLYEGFGLPPLEAMAAGLPVISSHSSSMPEVLGDAAITFNPESVEEAARALLNFFDNPSLARIYTKRGPEQAKRFTWEETGARTLAAYESLFKNG